MSIPSKPTLLNRYHWKLAELPSGSGLVPAPFTLRPAGEQELEDAVRVVQASYDLDPDWSGCAKHINQVILPGLRRAFEGEATCLFLLHGNRVIAVSAYDPEPADGIHFVTGPCVLVEYRNRGIGGALLHATLEALGARGLTEAVGLARPGTPSAKFLSRKFGGQHLPIPAPMVQPTGAESAVAA